MGEISIDYGEWLDESDDPAKRERAESIEMKQARFHAALINAREEPPVAESAAPIEEPQSPAEILAENLTMEHIERVRAAIAAITDLEVSVVEACNYTNFELVGVFNQATEYHNKITFMFDNLDSIQTYDTIRTGGTSAYSRTIQDYGAQAVQLHAKITHYDQRLSRLTQGITTRAMLQNLKGLRP